MYPLLFSDCIIPVFKYRTTIFSYFKIFAQVIFIICILWKFRILIQYIATCRLKSEIAAVARERLGEDIISATAVTSCNNRKAAGAVLPCGPAPGLRAVAGRRVGTRRTGSAWCVLW
jgi:hypothetical protein